MARIVADAASVRVRSRNRCVRLGRGWTCVVRPVRRPTLDRVICAGVRALCAVRAGDLQVRPTRQTPTTGAAIASPFVAISQSFGKQANVYCYEIYEIIRATATRDYSEATPADQLMERLLD